MDIILVHGSFHTSECWKMFVPELAKHGFVVHNLTLGGHRGTERKPSDASLQSYGDDVIAVAEKIGRPAILMGHSLGGLAISEAAERRSDLFPALIYLTAIVPRFGKISTTELAPVSQAMQDAAVAGLEKMQDGAVPFPTEAARDVFYNACSPDIQDYALSCLSYQPIDAMMGAIETSMAKLGKIPKFYIECTRDNAMPIENQRALVENMPFGAVYSLNSDHSPFLSMPSELAAVVLEIAVSHHVFA
jgi:pimeloyl-ACP methyl ester carboxylesterase